MFFDVIGIGSPFIDIFHTKDGPKKSIGQVVVNTMLVAQRLGLKTGIIGRVGNDEYGKYIINILKRDGIDTSHIVIDRYPTTQIHIKVKNGERYFTKKKFYKPIKRLTKQDKKYILSARSVFIRERNPIFPSFVRYIISKKHIKIFLSLHDFRKEGIDIETIKKIRPAIIFSNEDEFKKICNDMEYFMNMDTKVVVTNGKNGCTVYYKGIEKHFPSFKVEVVDPTGAGDAFAGGFIFGELKGWGLNDTAMLANALGALTVTEVGACEKAFYLKDVIKFMKLGYINLNST